MSRSSRAIASLLFLGAACAGQSPSAAPSPDAGAVGATACEVPGLSPGECASARALRLPAELPPARGNKYGDRDDAAQLGFHLFFNTEIGHGVGCPTCHLPELTFTDRLPVSKGKGEGARNAPTVFNAGRLGVIFWDGRADSLWSQPLFAIENPLEMASSRLEVAHYVADNPTFKTGYEQVFGPLPDMSAWPAAGKPGDAAFDALDDATKDQVNRIAANAGKSLEAYMRKNSSQGAALDRFLAGDQSALVEPAQRGLAVFVQKKCVSCHSGPTLSDESFHNVGFPGRAGAAVDRGRAGGIPVLQNNIFNLAGPYADPGPGVPATPPAGPGEEGAFRTPSLRNVSRTAPYGHDGALTSLDDVLDLHAPGLVGTEHGDLIAFFMALNGDYPPPPWNNWPSHQ